MGSHEPSYDVFLSYSHAPEDSKWTMGTLLPALAADGLRVCIDTSCFRLGEPLLLEIGRAVERSRFTLAVLSPAYVVSSFGELENVMAEHLGVEEGGRRLICVVREPCRPRLGLRSRIYLDMSNPETYASNLPRLIQELRTPGNGGLGATDPDPRSGPAQDMPDDWDGTGSC